MNPADRYFPHRAAGFRSNPFRALSNAEWAEVAVIGAETSAAFRAGNVHIQLLGGLGAGKTTTLLGLMLLAQDAGQHVAYEYLAEGEDALITDLASCTLLLLDEAQRLSTAELARLLDVCAEQPARAGTAALRLVFASHVDLTTHLAARRLPLVTCSVEVLPVAAWRAILDARIEAAALPGRPYATLSDDAVALLAETFGGNRRAAVAALYDIFQQVQAPEIVNAARLRIALAMSSDAPAGGTANSSRPARSNSRCSRAAPDW
jgi:hypothetical protein